MQELDLNRQMELTGGNPGVVIFCIVMGTAVIKLLRSAAGRVSIARLLTLEWR